MRVTRLDRWLAFVTALMVLSVAAACTSDDESPAAAVRTSVEKVWTAAGIDPVSSVRNVGGVAVVYGATPGGLLIFGLSPDTGAQLWSKQASLPIDVDEASVTSVGDRVTYLRPTGSDRMSQVVIADASTGADHSISAPRRWNGTGTGCPDDAGSVCLNSYLQLPDGNWDRRIFRVNVDSGATTLDQQSDFSGGYSLGYADLSYERPDDRPVITRRSTGAVTWSSTFADLFGPGITSLGPHWYAESPDGSYSMMSIMAAGSSSSLEEIDLAADTVTAAFDLSEGSARWISAGSLLGCFGDHPLLRWRAAEGSTPQHAFRCRYTGTAIRTISAPDGTQNVTSNLHVTLESFDPGSGSVTWSADLGDARTLAADATLGRDESVLDDQHLFVPNTEGGLIVDLTTGDTRPPTGTDTFWCADTRFYERPEPYFSDDTKPVTLAHRDGVYRTCTADGTDTATPDSVMPDEVSTWFPGDRRILATSNAVAGFAVPPVGEPIAGVEEPTSSVAASPSGPPGSAVPASAPPLDAPELAWRTTGYEPLTSVRMIGGTAVLYATIGSDLILIGLDPATGAERWRQPASAAGFAPTTELVVTEIEGSVAYLRPTATQNQMTQVVLADPGTGADRLVTGEHWWIGLPLVCEQDTTFLCASSYEPRDGGTLAVTAMRIELSTGSLSFAPAADNPYDAYFGDVVRVNGAPTETVGVLEDGALLWSSPVSALIGGERSDRALSITGLRPGNPQVVYISSTVGWLFDQTTGYPQLDLAANLTTVAMNDRTGAVLWREPATSTNCRGLLGDIEKLSTPGSAYPALRCRYAGQLNSTPPGSVRELTASTNLSVTIERVDLQTGKAVWAVPVGDARSLAVDSNGIAMIQLDDHRILVNGQVIDLDAGSVRPPTAQETFWCPARQSFRQGVVGYERGLPRSDRAAGGEVYQCDAKATPMSTTPTDVPLAVSTMTDAGLRLVSSPAGVLAYRVPV